MTRLRTQLRASASNITATVSSKARSVTSTASSKVQSAAGTIWDGVGAGTSVISSMTQSGVRKATMAAGSARSTLAGAIQQGTTDTRSILEFLNSQAKDGVATTNNRAKELVLQFTGKSEYRFGDITQELVRRVSSTDINLQDALLLLKILVTIGASVTPVAKLLPLKMLLDMLNVSLEARIGGKLLEVLAGSLDDRFKAALTAEELGDLAKRSLVAGIVSFTGKERYEEGDIERVVAEEVAATGQSTTNNPGSPEMLSEAAMPRMLRLQIDPEFEAWDDAFREKHPGEWEQAVKYSFSTAPQATSPTTRELDVEIVSELEDWDRRFKHMHPDQ